MRAQHAAGTEKTGADCVVPWETILMGFEYSKAYRFAGCDQQTYAYQPVILNARLQNWKIQHHTHHS